MVICFKTYELGSFSQHFFLAFSVVSRLPQAPPKEKEEKKIDSSCGALTLLFIRLAPISMLGKSYKISRAS
jgi:hypothetical protein